MVNKAMTNVKEIFNETLDIEAMTTYIYTRLISNNINSISKKEIESILLSFLNELNEYLYKNDKKKIWISNFGAFKIRKNIQKVSEGLLYTTKKETTVYKINFYITSKLRKFIYSMVDMDKTITDSNIKYQKEKKNKL